MRRGGQSSSSPACEPNNHTPRRSTRTTARATRDIQKLKKTKNPNPESQINSNSNNWLPRSHATCPRAGKRGPPSRRPRVPRRPSLRSPRQRRRPSGPCQGAAPAESRQSLSCEAQKRSKKHGHRQKFSQRPKEKAPPINTPNMQ
jgi:hypothetical protein